MLGIIIICLILFGWRRESKVTGSAEVPKGSEEVDIKRFFKDNEVLEIG